MISKKKAIFLGFILSALFMTAPSRAENEPGEELLAKSDKLMRGDSSIVRGIFSVHTPQWSREYEMEAFFKGLDDSFIRTLAPAKYKNQTYLRKGAKMWQYLPSAERDILIPPSLMLDQFLGSDYSNDDFVKASYYARDYQQNILREETLDGFEAVVIENLPNPEAPITYNKIISWLKKDTAAPLKEEYYDEQNNLFKTQYYSEFKVFGDRTIPSVWKMVNNQKEGHYTVIRTIDAHFNVPIEDAVFTREHLAEEK